MFQPAPGSPARPGRGRTAGLERDPHDRLGAALEAIAIEVLGHDGPRWLDDVEAGRVGTVVSGSVAAAARVAIERLEAELTGALDRRVPNFDVHADDERRRVELGLD